MMKIFDERSLSKRGGGEHLSTLHPDAKFMSLSIFASAAILETERFSKTFVDISLAMKKNYGRRV